MDVDSLADLTLMVYFIGTKRIVDQLPTNFPFVNRLECLDRLRFGIGREFDRYI